MTCHGNFYLYNFITADTCSNPEDSGNKIADLKIENITQRHILKCGHCVAIVLLYNHVITNFTVYFISILRLPVVLIKVKLNR